MKKIELPARNFIDRAIEYAAPRLAAKRLQARVSMALVGGYTGARIDKASMGGWRASAGSPNTDILPDLDQLRARSRDLSRNAPIATAAVATSVTHVVGTGLSMKPRIDQDFLGLSDEEATEWAETTDREWKLFSESTHCDYHERLNFYGIQQLAFRSTLESGDVFVQTPMEAVPGRPYELRLQLIEADRVCNPNFASDTPTLAGGIEMNEGGRPVAVHVTRGHPGDLRRASTWDPRPIYGASGQRRVLHLFQMLRPDQPRGVPLLAPVIEPLKQAGSYTTAELQSAVTSALYSVFITMDPEAFQSMYETDAQTALVDKAKKWTGEIEAGQAVNLLPGESIESSNPGRPNANFDPFMQSIIAQIGAALEIPYEVLVMRYQSSYSAARAALLQAWRIFRTKRDWLATYLCQPIYELFLEEAVAKGRIWAPGYLTDPMMRRAWAGAEWVGDGPGALDPLKEVMAAEKRIDIEISTRDAESTLHDGVDWKLKNKQLGREQRARREQGLNTDGADKAPAPPERIIEEID